MGWLWRPSGFEEEVWVRRRTKWGWVERCWADGWSRGGLGALRSGVESSRSSGTGSQSPRSSCGGDRAGAGAGRRVGRPRCSRSGCAMSGCARTARMRTRPPQWAHRVTSMSNTRQGRRATDHIEPVVYSKEETTKGSKCQVRGTILLASLAPRPAGTEIRFEGTVLPNAFTGVSALKLFISR